MKSHDRVVLQTMIGTLLFNIVFTTIFKVFAIVIFIPIHVIPILAIIIIFV